MDELDGYNFVDYCPRKKKLSSDLMPVTDKLFYL
jgi:hypothetical protein